MEPFTSDEIRQEISKITSPPPKKEVYVCPECENTGIVKENGSCHTCWKCLQEGRLDAHSKNVPNNPNIRL